MSALRKLHEKQAKRWRREASRKLRQGRGVDGRFLRPKKIPNGRPLGFGRSAAGVPGRTKRGRVKAFLSGYDVTVAQRIGDTVFHTGRTRRGFQVPRPYVGLSRAQLKRNAKELADTLAREGRRLGVFR